jgi:hypothetical protein
MKVIDQGSDFVQRVKLEDDILYTETIQQDREVLQLNRAIQANGGAQSLDFGQPVLNMPFVEWINLTKRYPDLIHGDPQTRKRLIARICKEYPQYAIGSKSKYHEVIGHGR